MLKNITPRTPIEIVERTIEFADAEGNGFVFNVDEKFKPIFPCKEAKENFEYALANPDKFEIYNELITRRRVYVEPAHGTCTCGREVTLENEYRGACECGCGRWYNLFGQELLPPEYWENDDEEWW